LMAVTLATYLQPLHLTKQNMDSKYFRKIPKYLKIEKKNYEITATGVKLHKDIRNTKLGLY
jgi:hypothetical protein